MRIRASARHEEPVAIGRSNSEDRSPNTGGQVLMHPWSMCFSNVNMEHAYAKACERSVSPVLVLSVINMLQFCLLCIGVGLDCKMVREYVFALYSVSLPVHAAEVCSFIWPSSTEESSGRSLIDRFRVLSIGFAFVVYNLMSYIAQEYPQTTSDFGMSAKSFISGMFDDCCSEGSFACNILGLGINAPIAVFINVFPYLSYYKPAAKFFLPCCCIGIHVIAPCWQLPSGIEPLIIGINTLAGVGLGTIIEHLRRSTFRDLHQSRVNQRQAVQAKVVGGLHFAHNIKGKCDTAGNLANAVISSLESVQIDVVERAVQLMHRLRFLLDEMNSFSSQRQVCAQLELGTYRSERTVCDVDARVKKMAGFDVVVRGCAAVTCCVDESILTLALNEALSNARRFGSREAQITISTQIDEGADGAGRMLRVEMDSVNGADVPLLSADECMHAVESVPAWSEGVGLATVNQAAHAIGGRVWLHAYASEDTPRLNHTVFHLTIPVEQVVWRAGAIDTAEIFRRRAAHEIGVESLRSQGGSRGTRWVS